MKFSEVVAQASALLQRKGRITYRALQREFSLDEAALADLKDELIDGEQVARDEQGKVLVWTGNSSLASRVQSLESQEQERGPAVQTLDARRQTLDAAAERRQLTVMFCDLVGSTPLAEKLDPEDLREVILAYQQACAAVIRRFEGYLARYVGDGLLVYFSYPQAHEDDAQRAIRAGLGIVTALPDLNTQLQQRVKVLRDFPLQVRIGIHTGLVVVGDMGGGGHRDPMAIVGETPNIAARVQGLAEPNTVVISEATARLVRGLFECYARGPQALKGVSMPVPVYRVLQESEAQSRFEVAVRTGLTPLVGRDEELGLLRRRWEQAKADEGQAVLLSGEPGIGKSRLVQTLKEWALTEGATRIEFRCSPYYQNSAFSPIVDHLQRLLQFAPHEAPQAKLAKLSQRLTPYCFPQADTLPLLASLLSLPHPDGPPSLTLSPQKQKQKTQEALVAWLVEEAEKAAVYCAWEDLHWADPSTLEVLTLFLAQVPTTRMLAVLTFRPEFLPPWGARSYLTPLMLRRLDRPQVERMVEKVSGGKALPAAVLQQIVAKTDGVPLFVEELSKMVLESGLVREANGYYELAGPLPPLAIPATLQDSLMARLDRLSTVRELAQLGATLGREFSYELLQAVAPVDEGTLRQGLQQLVAAELVYQRGVPPRATYLFKHALIQDAAYQSLLKSTRQQYHRQIAQVLEERFAEIKDTQPELVAQHYTEAGLTARAIPYWQQAGQKAISRSANAEAIAHLTKGLELLKTLPDTGERVQQELTLQVPLGSALIFTKGFGTPEVEQAYTRARELCQRMGETPQLVPVLWGLSYFYNGKGDFQTATELAEQLMRVAQSIQDPAALILAHRMGGAGSYWQGKLAVALEHFRQALVLYDRQRHQTLDSLSASDSEIYCQGYTALALWHLGYPDQALTRVHEALLWARELSHPNSLAYALGFAALLSQLRRDARAVQEQTKALIMLCTTEGLPFFLASGTMGLGWALVEQGQGAEGIAQIRRGLAMIRAIRPGQVEALWLLVLAEACGRRGQSEEGLAVVAEALALIDKGVRAVEAELYRLKGTLMLQSPAQRLKSEVEEEAEEYFLKAIDIARQQQAKSLELRAVMSLSRL